jgi:hypothetical protein
MELILYSHDDCPLCDCLESLLVPHLEKHNLSLIKRNIKDNPAWHKAYRHRIPVLVADGREILEGKSDEQTVERVVAMLGAG